MPYCSLESVQSTNVTFNFCFLLLATGPYDPDGYCESKAKCVWGCVCVHVRVCVWHGMVCGNVANYILNGFISLISACTREAVTD